MENLFYRVKKDENLLSVSAKFSVPAGIIAADNNLKTEPAEGDILLIRRIDGKLYKIKPEDTLCSIAKDFNVSEETILNKNEIPYVFAGEIIII